MQVYRIETRDGRGICAATGSPLCSIYQRIAGDETEHCYFNTRSDECKAAQLAKQSNMAYAFPTMEALFNWFPQSRGRKAMESFGATGVVYEVPDVEIKTKYQCVFDKRKAHKIGSFAL